MECPTSYLLVPVWKAKPELSVLFYLSHFLCHLPALLFLSLNSDMPWHILLYFSFCVLFQCFCTVCDIGRPCSWLCPVGMFAIPTLSLIREKQLHMGLIKPQCDLHFKESFLCFFKL